MNFTEVARVSFKVILLIRVFDGIIMSDILSKCSDLDTDPFAVMEKDSKLPVYLDISDDDQYDIPCSQKRLPRLVELFSLSICMVHRI